jgi:hypothetical protein
MQLRQLAQRLSRIESALEVGATLGDPTLSVRPDEIRARLHKLAQRGIDHTAIARELGLSVSEVELMLKFQKAAVRA